MWRVALTTTAVLALVAGSTTRATPSVVAVEVRLGDGPPRLSRTTAPVGTAAFTVRNTGRVKRSFGIGGVRTKLLEPGRRQTLRIGLARAGSYPWSVKARGRTLHRGRFRALSPPTPDPTPTLTALGQFAAPTDVDSPPGDPSRLVVVEQAGVIQLLVDGQLQATPFVDLRDRVLRNGEAGLLNIAFHPAYATTGLAYVFYNDHGGNINVVELRGDADDPNRLDPATARTLLYEVKFAPNHNGGMLQFGPDDGLYVSIGDGGSSSDVKPGEYAQSDGTLWGKILRLDPETGARAEIARGFRNPWRFWIDSVTGDTWVADVGQERREEIDVIPAGQTGLNFGWPCFEGTLPFDAGGSCGIATTAPVFEYDHGAGSCSVTGGVVSRDPRLPQLDGVFLFTDFCGGALRGLRRTGSGVEPFDLGLTVPRPTSFGTDSLGRVYVASGGGAVLRLDAG